jgi:hypothetical protein
VYRNSSELGNQSKKRGRDKKREKEEDEEGKKELAPRSLIELELEIKPGGYPLGTVTNALPPCRKPTPHTNKEV